MPPASQIGPISKDPIATPRGPAFVKPAVERPAGVPPFEELKAKGTQDFQTERRETEAQEKLAPAAREIASGASLASLAARFEEQVPWQRD